MDLRAYLKDLEEKKPGTTAVLLGQAVTVAVYRDVDVSTSTLISTNMADPEAASLLSTQSIRPAPDTLTSKQSPTILASTKIKD
jgi:transcription elongation GreA/GreB family factor